MKSLIIVCIVAFALGAVACSDSPIQPSKGAPVISLFSADTTKITVNQFTNLRWEVLDKTATVRIDPYPLNVPSIGSFRVDPLGVGPITFTLTASNEFGVTQRSLSINVTAQ